MISYVIPILIIGVIIYCVIKKVNAYDTFVSGAKKSLSLTVSIFPFIIAIFVLIEVYKASGVSAFLVSILEKPFAFIGVPKQLVELTLLRPFSGSGSLALLSEIYANYGVDSYIGRSASAIMGSSETVFYVSAVYFSKTRVEKLGYAIPISLVCSLFGAICACMFCSIF